MNFNLLDDVIGELSVHLVQSRLERIFQGVDGNIYMLFRRDRKEFLLLLSPNRSLPRLHLVGAKPNAEPKPHPFVLYLRSHLTGARLDLIALENQDRVVVIHFMKMKVRYHFIFELTGSAANMILTDSSLKILAIYYVRSSSGVGRPLMPGVSYVLPKKCAPEPRGGFKSSAERGRDTENGLKSNKEAEKFYQDMYAQKKTASLRIALESTIKKALVRIERRIFGLSDDLRSASRAEEYKEAGSLILANLDRVTMGHREIRLTGFDGEPVILQLDPNITPSRNADRFFKKYKKAKAGHLIITLRLQQATKEVQILKSLLTDLVNTPDYTGLNKIRSELAAGGYIREERRRERRPDQPTRGYTKIPCHGWDIMVGKSAAGNDYISTKLAASEDIWLHAEDVPGSHVLIKNPNRTRVPQEVLLKAASLAAYYSKARNAAKVSVIYSYARHVKKPKGAKAGLVVVNERQSIMVNPVSD